MAHESFDVGGMTCAACQAHVEKAVCKLAGVENVAVNLLSGSMTVDFDETSLSDQDICDAVDRAGYSAAPVAATGANGVQGATAGAMATGDSAARLESPTKKLEATARAIDKHIHDVFADLSCHACAPCVGLRRSSKLSQTRKMLAPTNLNTRMTAKGTITDVPRKANTATPEEK